MNWNQGTTHHKAESVLSVRLNLDNGFYTMQVVKPVADIPILFLVVFILLGDHVLALK